MSKKLFVGGLSWGTDETGFRAAFERFGEIEEAVVVRDRDTGRSRGFGFVTFIEGEAADKAIAEMNETELDGRRIIVNEARERAPRGEGRFNDGGRRGGGGGGGGRGGFGGGFGGGRGGGRGGRGGRG